MRREFLVAAILASGSLVVAAGCSLGGAAMNTAPAPFARFIQNWTYDEFAGGVEAKDASIRLGNPWPFYSPFGMAELKEMRGLSRPGDKVSLFENASIDTSYYCLMRDGHIVKTWTLKGLANRTSV